MPRCCCRWGSPTQMSWTRGVLSTSSQPGSPGSPPSPRYAQDSSHLHAPLQHCQCMVLPFLVHGPFIRSAEDGPMASCPVVLYTMPVQDMALSLCPVHGGSCCAGKHHLPCIVCMAGLLLYKMSLRSDNLHSCAVASGCWTSTGLHPAPDTCPGYL